MKYISLILLITLTFSKTFSDNEMFNLFAKFIVKYNKNYSSMQEYLYRFSVFSKNVNDLSKIKTTYKRGITMFSDLTDEEFKKQYLTQDFGEILPANLEKINPNDIPKLQDEPDIFDYRDVGWVNPPMDKKDCMSAYAFTVTTNIEGQYRKIKKDLFSFSTQQIVDCDNKDAGCGGGLPERTLQHVIDNGGLMFEKDYPYTGVKGSCKFDKEKLAVKVLNYKKLGDCPSTSTLCEVEESKVQTFLLNTGPLIAGINGALLKDYKEGIMYGDQSACDKNKVNTFVNIVGYGHGYWLCKAYFGTQWGEKGYFRIKSFKSVCGINMYIMTGYIDEE